MAAAAAERNALGLSTAEDLVKEEVFKQAYIPQRLDEVNLIFRPSMLRSRKPEIYKSIDVPGRVLRKRYSSGESW